MWYNKIKINYIEVNNMLEEGLYISSKEAIKISGLNSCAIWRIFKEIREHDEVTRKMRGNVNRKKFYEYIGYVPSV